MALFLRRSLRGPAAAITKSFLRSTLHRTASSYANPWRSLRGPSAQAVRKAFKIRNLSSSVPPRPSSSPNAPHNFLSNNRFGRLLLFGSWGVLTATFIGVNMYLFFNREEGTMTLHAAAPVTKTPSGPPPEAFMLRLKSIVGERCVTKPADLESHGKDFSYHAPAPPNAVVYPIEEKEVVSIVKLCNEYKVPIIAYGSGTSLEGHTVARRGGICLDMSKMDKVLRFSEKGMDITVQPGLRRELLNDYLADQGSALFFPVDPGPGASIGGMVSTSCSGTRAVRYGTMKDNVLCLRVVLPNGEVVKTGVRARKSSAGYDLTHLFIGAEGTLGVVTEVTLKLKRQPQDTAVAVCGFPSIEAAADAVIDAMLAGAAGPAVERIELLDSVMMRGVIETFGSEEGLFEERPTIFIEIGGSNQTEIAAVAESLKQVCSKHQGGPWRVAADAETREELWRARKEALWIAPSALKPNAEVMITDVCVPLSHFSECVHETFKDLNELGVLAPMVAHAGDGNFHLFVLMDPNNPAEKTAAATVNDRLVRRAIGMEGTCTGEHGVGEGKIQYLPLQLGPSAVFLMKTIKKAVDPNNIMNPGKVVEVDE